MEQVYFRLRIKKNGLSVRVTFDVRQGRKGTSIGKLKKNCFRQREQIP